MIPLEEIRRARERIGDDVLRTPLVPLGTDDRVLLKLECLHPIGSFKLRGAFSAIRAASAAELASGVVTASAGCRSSRSTRAAASTRICTSSPKR